MSIDAGTLVLVQERDQVWGPDGAAARRKLMTRVPLGPEVHTYQRPAGYRVIDCRCGTPLRIASEDLGDAIRRAERTHATVNCDVTIAEE